MKKFVFFLFACATTVCADTIVSVRENTGGQSYVVETDKGTMCVPLSENNLDYQRIRRWVATGGTISPLDTKALRAKQLAGNIVSEYKALQALKRVLDDPDVQEDLAAQPLAGRRLVRGLLDDERAARTTRVAEYWEELKEVVK